MNRRATAFVWDAVIEELDLPLPTASRDGLQEAALLARGIRLRAEADAAGVVDRARADAQAIVAQARHEAAAILARAELQAANLKRPSSDTSSV